MRTCLFAVALVAFFAVTLVGSSYSISAEDEVIVIKSPTQEDIDAAKKTDSLLKDPKITKGIDMGLMKTYCCTCTSSMKSHEFKGWSWPQAIARCMAECSGPCNLHKGGCN